MRTSSEVPVIREAPAIHETPADQKAPFIYVSSFSRSVLQLLHQVQDEKHCSRHNEGGK